MPSESAVSDFWLEFWANEVKDILNAGDAITCHLFQNDYHPIPGVVIGDLTEADFDGYSAVVLVGTWSSVAIADHIAFTTFSAAAVFTVDSGYADSQTVYGYYLTDVDDNLLDVVRFANSRLLYAFDTLDVTPILRVLNPA